MVGSRGPHSLVYRKHPTNRSMIPAPRLRDPTESATAHATTFLDLEAQYLLHELKGTSN
jgi:hypothetical protein